MNGVGVCLIVLRIGKNFLIARIIDSICISKLVTEITFSKLRNNSIIAVNETLIRATKIFLRKIPSFCNECKKRQKSFQKCLASVTI